MLEVNSSLGLEGIEFALRRASESRGASVLAITDIGRLVRGKLAGSQDALIFTVGHEDLYAALLDADIRFAAFLPCRIAAIRTEGGVRLYSMSPVTFCLALKRPDAAPIAGPLESLLLDIMEEASRPAAASAQAASGEKHGSLGATEDQMNVRGALPQRIDQKGTKVEDLGGTGKHDAQGG